MNEDDHDEEEEEDGENDEEEEEEEDEDEDGEDEEEEENQRRYDFRQRKTVVRYQAPQDGTALFNLIICLNGSMWKAWNKLGLNSNLELISTIYLVCVFSFEPHY